MDPREVHIDHNEPWAFGQHHLESGGAVSNFEHGTVGREVFVE
jgi:hypothetical protein